MTGRRTLERVFDNRWGSVTLAHFVATIAAFWLAAIAGAGVADSQSGIAPWWLSALEALLTFGLLQPLAYWVVTLATVPYWTYPGLALTIAVFAVNSIVAVTVLRTVARLLAKWRSQ